MTSKLWLATMMVGGALLRLLSPTREALWRDEAQFAAIARLPDVAAILQFLYNHESHPPLFYLFGHIITKLGLDLTSGLGAITLGASIAAIPAVYLIGRSAYGELAGLIGGAGTAASVPLALLSVELRPYSLLALLYLLSCAALWRYIHSGGTRWLVIWAAANVIGLYTHYFTLVVLAAQVVLAGALLLVGALSSRRARSIGLTLLGSGGLWAPGAMMLAHQIEATGYPAMRPLQVDGPPRLLARTALDFPLEVCLPLLLVSGIALLSLRDGRHHFRASASSRVMLLGAAPVALVIATIGQYRSQLLTAHVLMPLTPLGMLSVGGAIAILLQRGRRLTAIVVLELAVAGATLSAVQQEGYLETTADLVADLIEIERRTSDLIVVAPGFAGVSFNHYFDSPNSQFHFPSPVALERYPFDNEFDRIASLAAYTQLLDTLTQAHAAGRRVWLVADARWVNSRVAAPVLLTRAKHGGLAQAERSRTRRIFVELEALYGRPTFGAGEAALGLAREPLAAWLFESASGGP